MGLKIKSMEIYSIVQKRHKVKPEQANGDYYECSQRQLLNKYIVDKIELK